MGDLHKLGSKGETFALAVLRKRGHRLLERNFRCPLGELDLITWHQGTLVFVEVRAREAHPQRHPAESVGPSKQRRTIRAAQWYLSRRAGAHAPACRFDVLWITARQGEILEHGVIEGAFTA